MIIKEKDWKEIGLKYYKDIKDFKFRCPNCKHNQSVNSVMKNNKELTEKEVREFITSNCEGRYTKGKGCDWCLGGLFHIHKLEILQKDGRRHPVFEFADDKVIQEVKEKLFDCKEFDEKKKLLETGTLWELEKDMEVEDSNHNGKFTILKKGQIVEFRYSHGVHFRTIKDKYYYSNEGYFLSNCKYFGKVLSDVRWKNQSNLKEILSKKLFETKEIQGGEFFSSQP